MKPLANLVTLPFFARMPARATAVAQRAIQRVWRQELGSQATEFSYNLFCTELREVDVDGPTFDEFATWIRNLPPEPSAPNPTDLPAANALFHTAGDPVDRALKAYAIVVNAVRLQQSMIEGGYSPDCVEMEDQIVAEAIKEWLAYEASAEEESGFDTKPVELAFGMLRPSEQGSGDKLLDILATHMQRELALAIVNAKARAV